MANSTVRIRKGTAADVDFLIAAGQDSSSAQWSESQYRDLFEYATGGLSRLVLVAEEGPAEDASSRHDFRPGFLVARHVAPDWELENIVVRPTARRNGLGVRLLNALIESARATDSDAVFLEVRESNAAARRLYEKVGFKQTGRRKSYYTNPLEDAVLYRLRLP